LKDFSHKHLSQLDMRYSEACRFFGIHQLRCVLCIRHVFIFIENQQLPNEKAAIKNC